MKNIFNFKAMTLLTIKTEDTRTSLMYEPASELIPTSQDLTKTYYLFGIKIYTKHTILKDEIKFNNKTTPGYK